MQHPIFIIDSRNKVGHPTFRSDMIRKLLKKNKAKVLRGGLYNNSPILVQIFKPFDDTKTIECEFRIGIDPGYKFIGFSLYKFYKNTIIKILSGQVETRTAEITELLKTKKMFRQSRRHVRRKNIKRKYSHVKFRKPIWKNRSKRRFQPTHLHLINSHWNLLKYIFTRVPLESSKIHIEYCKFDIHKIINPKVFGVGYQNGSQFGFENIKNYVRNRDGYTCQACKSNDISNITVHHIKLRSDNGSDRPDNLITVCEQCHLKIHTNKIACPQISSGKNYRDGGVLNSCIGYMFNYLETYLATQDTFGYVTKIIRDYNKIPKTHSNDASIIALCDSLGLQDISAYNYIDCNIDLNFKQFRRHTRAVTKRYEDRKYYLVGSKKAVAWNRRSRCDQDPKKPSLEDFKKKYSNINLRVEPGKKVSLRSNTDMKFRPGEIIKYKDKNYGCKGWASTRSGVLLETLGEVKQKLCKKILNRSGMVLL